MDVIVAMAFYLRMTIATILLGAAAGPSTAYKISIMFPYEDVKTQGTHVHVPQRQVNRAGMWREARLPREHCSKLFQILPCSEEVHITIG